MTANVRATPSMLIAPSMKLSLVEGLLAVHKAQTKKSTARLPEIAMQP